MKGMRMAIALLFLLPLFSGTALGGFLDDLAKVASEGRLKVIDLTQTLSERTPVIQLPPPLANSPGLKMHVISRYDEKGPAWYWNWFEVGEHTGTHFDAPCHWITGRDLPCLDKIPATQLIGPAVVIDVAEKVAKNPDYILTVADIRAWEKRYGRIPKNAFVLMRTGWSKYADDAAKFFNVDAKGQPHWPGFSKETAEFLTKERSVLGVGTEAIGTDAGIAGGFTPPFPNHNIMHGAGKFGLTSLTNLDKLPAKGAVLIVAPMKLKDGSGSPVRVLALVP